MSTATAEAACGGGQASPARRFVHGNSMSNFPPEVIAGAAVQPAAHHAASEPHNTILCPTKFENGRPWLGPFALTALRTEASLRSFWGRTQRGA
eukprot:CAMPEP_0195056108 /NCGR_PEP_ID=MMETSP0448-20130528/4652_1 /TAXON_ID=66468 /ORGANISM="Heterocapsa triquestra, Strain CCMP 448" /LENGTH=93 /DNA_ID=CAMNT_0040085901 /DNA_START=163 /DNA_END=442 /DNA_ORIENTATION=+